MFPPFKLIKSKNFDISMEFQLAGSECRISDYSDNVPHNNNFPWHAQLSLYWKAARDFLLTRTQRTVLGSNYRLVINRVPVQLNTRHHPIGRQVIECKDLTDGSEKEKGCATCSTWPTASDMRSRSFSPAGQIARTYVLVVIPRVKLCAELQASYSFHSSTTLYCCCGWGKRVRHSQR